MKYALPAILGLLLSGAAFADEVELNSGHRLEGIARQENGQVIVETRLGTVTVPADEVKSITPGKTALHEYQERLADIGDHPQADRVFDLARWAQERGLIRYVNTLLQWTIALNPDHAQARQMLDYVRLDNRWVPRHEGLAYLAPAQEHHQERSYASRTTARRTRPLPEMSPGYVYFGIPPSPPRRGTENHGYSAPYSFSYGSGSYGMSRGMSSGSSAGY